VKRNIVLGDGRRVPLGVYVAAWKIVKAAEPGQMFNRSLLERWPASAAEILGHYRDGLHDRINKHLPGYGVGRKWSSHYQGELVKARAQLQRSPHSRINWFPAELRSRLAQREAA
jgi:hypothetical protein